MNALEHDVTYLGAPDRAAATQSMKLSSIYERVYTSKYKQWLHMATFIDDVRLVIVNVTIDPCLCALGLLFIRLVAIAHEFKWIMPCRP